MKINNVPDLNAFALSGNDVIFLSDMKNFTEKECKKSDLRGNNEHGKCTSIFVNNCIQINLDPNKKY